MEGEKRQVYMKFREGEGSIRLEWRYEYRPDNEGPYEYSDHKIYHANDHTFESNRQG